MNFLTNLKRSAYDPSFYQELRDKPLSFSVKFFLKFVLFVALVKSIVIISSFFWTLNQSGDIENIRKTFVSLYPDELILTIRDGVVSSNMIEPYPIPMPTEWRNISSDPDERIPTNFAVIKTYEDISLGDFERYDTTVIIGQDAIGVYDPSEKNYQIEKLSRLKIGDVSLDKTQYLAFLNKWFDIVIKIGIAAIFLVFPVFVFFGLGIWNAIYLLFGAFIVWVISWIQNWNLAYWDSYRFGLHLITVPMLYTVFLASASPLLSFPFASTVILALLTFANMKKVASSQTTVVPEPKTEPLKEQSGLSAKIPDETKSTAPQELKEL